MERHTIRLGSTDSVNSSNVENFIDVELKSTNKLQPFPDVVGEVDAYEVFEEERDACQKYRLIVTINPYCTNVLFNALTEITKDEGSPNVQCITDSVSVTSDITEAMGVKRPTRMQMIMNTEYSKESIGYEYHIGYDFFTNHIIRNQTFKLVNLYDSSVTLSSMVSGQDLFCGDTLDTWNDDACRQVFNTIGDFMRYSDGTVVKHRKRNSISDSTGVSTDLNKHLYIYDDILSMEDSINENLAEDNGWFGITNVSNVSSKEFTETTSRITGLCVWEDLEISKILNNYENCEFIDMYPDRSLFSFNPKVNTFRKRLEYNWDVVLTYPYRSEYCEDIVTNVNSDGTVNGLKILTVTKTVNSAGTDILIFRSYAKHGLSRGNTIQLYVDDEPLSSTIKVTGVGNMSSDNDDYAKDYYFYTTDTTLLKEVFGLYNDTANGGWARTVSNQSEHLTTSDINDIIRAVNAQDDESNKGKEYRFRRIVSGIESQYYIRVFRKIPNLKNKKEKLTDEIAQDQEAFEDYIYGDNMNASENVDGGTDNPYMTEFNKEMYRLAFARTIYNDFSTQVTFTDTLDLDKLVDNLGRPLHEIYVTIVKNNKGYEEWYGLNGVTRDITSSNVEFSHCFGEVASGFEFYCKYDDRLDDNIQYNRAEMGDVHMINGLNCFGAQAYENDITSKGGCDKDEFYGDIVEYNPNECVEHVLESINHRFNTAQRELPDNNGHYYEFNYQEIEQDDNDATSTDGNEMIVTNYTVDDTVTIGGASLHVWQRPEGYYYQAHYPIQLKEFGNIKQDAHKDIRVKSAQPVQANGIYISVSTSARHGMASGDIVYLCFDDANDYNNDHWYKMTVAYVPDVRTFLTQPYNQTWTEFTEEIEEDLGLMYNWITLSAAILDTTDDTKRLKLRGQNTDIPNYASKISHNIFLWRELYLPGELSDSELTEYPYANDAFYVNKEINFFLKRQDPENISGLYCSSMFPNDVAGVDKDEDTYYYKDEDEITC